MLKTAWPVGLATTLSISALAMHAFHRLRKKWRDLSYGTREAFLEHVKGDIPFANKAVRVRKPAKAATAHGAEGNHVGIGQMLERIAKEVGNSFTNRRQVTGKDGGPISIERRLTQMTINEIDARLAELLKIESFTQTDSRA